MNIAASKLSSIPCIMPSGLGHERTNCISSGRFSIRRFSPLPCESLTKISVAPASFAASIAEFTSFVKNVLNREYSNPLGPNWSPVTAPTTPSISADM